MTEEEKILSGVMFCPADPTLVSMKLHAHRINLVYNQTPEEEHEKRNRLLHELVGELGEKCSFQGPIYFHYGRHTHIGDRFFANFNFTCQDDAEVFIGDDANFGPNVTIVTPVHPMIASERNAIKTADGTVKRLCYGKPVHIGNSCWLGANVTVCPGVTIGNNCVIGAGSVVTRDIPDNSFAAGVPCRVIRTITEADSMIHKPHILSDNTILPE